MSHPDTKKEREFTEGAHLSGPDIQDILSNSSGILHLQGGDDEARLGSASHAKGKGSPSLTGSESWTLFGRKTQRSKLEWLAQVLVLYILILTCLVNITLNNGNRELWSTLLGSSIGYLLPSPRMKVANYSGSPPK